MIKIVKMLIIAGIVKIVAIIQIAGKMFGIPCNVNLH
jgi:hypothetical protein